MKERPILFSGPMVRAILEGRKSQTRRIVKPQPPERWAKHEPTADGERWAYQLPSLDWHTVKCPYGKPGDRLWVRETFAYLDDLRTKDPGTGALADRAFFRADHATGLTHDDNPAEDLKWRPSIFMPRNLSRITLQITNVRVERLQEITFSDIRAEGKSCPQHDFDSGFCASECAALRNEWATGWDKINGKRKGCDWNSNPWVWVVEFKKL